MSDPKLELGKFNIVTIIDETKHRLNYPQINRESTPFEREINWLMTIGLFNRLEIEILDVDGLEHK
jgi:hypothetical protein